MIISEILLGLVGILRSIIPNKVRKYIQSSPIFHNVVRHIVSSLLRIGGKSQWIIYGPASGIRLVVSEHITEVYLTGKYEPAVQTALVKNLKPGDVMYDLGTSIGFFSLLGGKLVGTTGKVYAFEPAPHVFEILVEQIRANQFDWVIPVKKCLTDKPKKVTFAVTGNAYGSSIVNSQDRKWPILELDATSIDELVKSGSFLPPALIKIDVEDEEGNVLLGAKDTLYKFRPTIICEVHSSKSGRIIIPILEAHGYICTVLGEPNSDWHIIDRLSEGVEKRILAIHLG